MQRGSDKHSPRVDEALGGEVEGMIRAGRETRADESRSGEPSGEDQPDVDRSPTGTLTGGKPEGLDDSDVEGRAELACYLGKQIWPADGLTILAKASELPAPDHILNLVRTLPPQQPFATVGEVWIALRGGHETHRS